MSPAPPATPRDAATVVLLRDGRRGLQTWLLTRRTTLAFAAGMSVYPGGRVDADDHAVPLARPARAEEIAAGYGIDLDRAHAVLVAAARETFEETGVLLTVPPAAPGAHVAARTDVEAGTLPFGTLLAEQGLAVDVGALRPWSRWVTPAGEKRRYDARFFVGTLPPGAEPQDVTSESSSAGWLPVRTALTQAARGERALMPPTRVTLTAIAACGTVANVLAAADAQPLVAIEPRLRIGDDGSVAVELPDGSLHEVPRALLS